MTMRSVLESNHLSNTLQNWADLIFGFKARGKEAENVFNVYNEASYQEQIDITKVEDKGAQLRLVEFGLIPNQIMNKGKEITDSTCDLKYILYKSHNDNDKMNTNTVIKIVNISSDKLLVVNNNKLLVEKKINTTVFEKDHSFEDTNIINKFPFTNRMSQFYNPKINNNKIKLKLIIVGGFYDGEVKIISLNSKFSQTELLPFKDRLPILSISVDKEEELAFFGNSLGNVSIAKIDEDPSKFEVYDIITHQMSAISHIECSNDLNLWASASIDGYINLYTLPLSKLIRI